MEHRCGTRIPLVADVLIQNRDRKMFMGKAQNVSLGGMYVCTRESRLPVSSYVTVTAFRVTNRRQESFSSRAFVTHSSETGVGLMFIDPNSDAVHALKQILYDSAVA